MENTTDLVTFRTIRKGIIETMMTLHLMKIRRTTIQALLTFALLSCFSAAYAQDKPNIVLVFLDNFGWGEPGFNGGGIIRGAAAPRTGSRRCLVHRPT